MAERMCVARVVKTATRGKKGDRILGGTDIGEHGLYGITTHHQQGFWPATSPVELELEEGDEIVVKRTAAGTHYEIVDSTGRRCFRGRID